MSTEIYIGGGGGGIGVQGIQGIQGVQGLNGAFAAQGIQGIQGTQGLQGIQGATGIQGAIGNTGSQGTTGSQGITGAQGLQGVQGTDGIQGATGTGTQGIQGATGATGNTGAQGTTGLQGVQGTDGLQGATGIQGFDGLQGIQGLQGITGIQGADGIQGSVGLQGTQGIIGTQGIEGIQGATGIQGTNGAGTQGIQGIQGIEGTQGTQGIQGITGSQGVSNNIFFYEADANTYSGAPASGHILWNNATQISATQININHLTDAPIIDIDIFIALWQTGQKLTIQDRSNSANYQIWTISATPTYVSPTYWTIPVTLVTSAGTGTTGFANNHELLIAVTAVGSQGIQGLTGIQGNNGLQGITGLQGIQGTTGIQGSLGIQGIQGIQGTTGATGNTGSQGIQGITGIQGDFGIQGIQGLQGIQGVGNVGAQGTQGIQGIQGTQGIQGLQGDSGVEGYFYSAYDTTPQIAGAINTLTKITFNNTYGSNSVTLAATNLFRINESAIYKVQLEVQWKNSDVTNVTTGLIYAIINSTAQVGTTVRTKVEPLGASSATLEFTQKFMAGDVIEFAFEVDDTDLSLANITAAGSAPTGASAFANIAQVAKTLAPLDGNIQLNWTTGYVNLTNAVDNRIPFNTTIYNVGAATSASNLSTANAAVEFLYTGVYLFVVRAHLFDLGSNMTLSTTLYTSTDGTTWTLNTIVGLMRYTGTNTNQIQNATFTLRVTSLPFYVQPRLNPSANAPYPADLGAPTAFIVTRVGDL